MTGMISDIFISIIVPRVCADAAAAVLAQDWKISHDYYRLSTEAYSNSFFPFVLLSVFAFLPGANKLLYLHGLRSKRRGDLEGSTLFLFLLFDQLIA